jgi:hypothetical protein
MEILFITTWDMCDYRCSMIGCVVYNKYDDNLPYFILPISSATHDNIDSIKYSLYNLISMDKEDATISN